MARIRDILRQADNLRQRPAVLGVAAAGSARPSSPQTPTSQPEEETPFIEVGGPNGLMEASASVRAVPVPPKIPERSAVPPPSAMPQAPESRNVPTQPKPKDPFHLAFRAIPAEPGTLLPPAQRFARELVVFHQPDHPESQQYRQVLSGLKSQLPAAAAQALLFASSNNLLRAGPLILNLAIARSQEGPRPVVVVDANMRAPDLTTLLGLPAEEPGLRNVLAGNLSLKCAVRESGLEGLHVLAAGEGAQDPAGLLAGQAMHAVLRHLRDRYRWIFVSAPAWDGRPDIVALASACDAVYLVTTNENDDLKHIIPQQGGHLRGYLIISES